MKNLPLALVLVSMGAMAGNPSRAPVDVNEDCYFQARFIEKTYIAYQSRAMGTGQLYQESIQAFRGTPTEYETAWAKKVISFVYGDPQNQFVDSSAIANEYRGNCLMDPDKYLIKR